MSVLRTLEQIAEQEGLDTIYAIAADPHWLHYSADDCLRPIRDWIVRHHPDVMIEPTGGLAWCYLCGEDGQGAGLASSDDLPGPIFQIGFNAEQAAQFCLAWSEPPLQSLDESDSFYFLELRPRRYVKPPVLGGRLTGRAFDTPSSHYPTASTHF